MLNPELFLRRLIDPSLPSIRKSEHAFTTQEIDGSLGGSCFLNGRFNIVSVVAGFIGHHDDSQLARLRGLLVLRDDRSQ
jgi:hypothetical protein